MYQLFIICLLLCNFTAWAADPLPANHVFKPAVQVVDPNTVLLQWNIKDGAYLYRDRIKFKLKNQEKAKLGPQRFPEGEFKQDAILGRYQIYRQQVGIPLAILGYKPGQAVINFQYQGCTDKGFCYPPSSCQINLTINDDLEVTAATLGSPTAKPIASALMKPDQYQSIFATHKLWFIILTFLGLGLLLSFTPCVLPMIPVLSSIIVGHGKDISTRKAFTLSLTYVLSMSLTYAMVGLIIASLGSNLQAAFQQPWIIVLFSTLFVLLALSMFGFYDLKLPTSWQSAIAHASEKQQHGAYLGTAIMGILSTLILSPCVTAPLVGALAYIANTGDKLLGTLALFALGLGMGLPLLAIGTAAGKLLPKAGHWMNAVKEFFGVILIGMAIYLLDRIIPGQVTLLLWASLCIISSIYLGAFAPTQGDMTLTFWKGCGLIVFLYGAVLITGAALGNSDPWQPLANLRISEVGHGKTSAHADIRITTMAQLQQQLNQARQLRQPVLLDYYADWCVACKVMERTTLTNTKVHNAMTHFIVIKADITANNDDSKKLRDAFNVIAPPTYIFFDSHGVEVDNTRIIGETDAKTFLKALQKTRQHANGHS